MESSTESSTSIINGENPTRGRTSLPKFVDKSPKVSSDNINDHPKGPFVEKRSLSSKIDKSKSSFLVSILGFTSSNASHSWTLEYVTFFIGIGAIASIVGVLTRFNGQALPDWHYNITLNALISLLATIAAANVAVPLQNGLSQLKWVRFKSRHAQLSDMEAFDGASRGTLGAFKLLASMRGG
jgi:hypothetical protein